LDANVSRVNSKDRALLDAIRKNAGIGMRQVIKASGLAMGTGLYHLKALERKHLVRVGRTAGSTRFFESSISARNLQLKFLKQQTLQELILPFIEGPSEGMPFKQIVEKSGKASSTISAQLGILAKNRLIDVETKGAKHDYSLRHRNQVISLFRKYGLSART